MSTRVAAERDPLRLQQRALAGALGERAVGAHDPPPRQVGVVVARQHRAGEARRARARRRRRRARSPPACSGCGPARGPRASSSRISSRAMRHGTYSIVALDPDTGELGAAVQSHWFSVGSLCTWARPGRRRGRHAVRGRARARPERARPAGARRVRRRGARGAARRRRAAHRAPGRRSSTRAAAWRSRTGPDCIAHAGDATGATWSCQANMMERDTVPAAMSAAFEAASGDLAARLLAALQAAQAEGGDVRGRQSAALLVVPAGGRGVARPRRPARGGPRRPAGRARAAARALARLRAGRRGRRADGRRPRRTRPARCTAAPPSWRPAPTSCCSGRGWRSPTPATSTRASPRSAARPRSSRTGSCCSTGSRRTSPRPARRSAPRSAGADRSASADHLQVEVAAARRRPPASSGSSTSDLRRLLAERRRRSRRRRSSRPTALAVNEHFETSLLNVTV